MNGEDIIIMKNSKSKGDRKEDPDEEIIEVIIRDE